LLFNQDEDPTSTSLNEEVLDSSDSSSEDEEVNTVEDLLDVGDLEYEDEDASSGDGVRRYLRAYNDRRLGRRKSGRRGLDGFLDGHQGNTIRQPLNGQRGTSGQLHAKASKTAKTGGGEVPFTTKQLPYCPNGSMHFTGMGPCMATQFARDGVNACPSGTLGEAIGIGQCIVW
jgi:hypothetical protein